MIMSVQPGIGILFDIDEHTATADNNVYPQPVSILQDVARTDENEHT